MAEEIKPDRKVRRSLAQFRELNVLLAFLLLFIFFYSQSPKVFLKPANLAVIMRFIATFGMLSIGEVLIIITGGIDLSVGSLTALTGVIVATLMLKGFGGMPTIGMLPAIIIVLCIGTLFGLWHGFFVTKLRIPPFIITLGTWLIAKGLAALITHGYPIVYPSESSFLVLGQGSLFGIPISFIILVIFASLVSIILNRSRLGYRIYAVGGNAEASRLSGVNVDRVKLFCYGTSGFMAATTGILLASRLGQGTPTVGSAYELWAIAGAVIGGTSLLGGEGTILGAILGAAIVGTMQNGMVLLNVSSYLQDVVLGTVLVVAVVYDTLRRRRK
ncbi:MAG: ABC transporter permease [Anaerolineales bacterium]|nr:ABC transporter permease [Anaerolineales bacterium]